jgi:ADP-heptose:LPS heptosyltransferase
VGPLGLPAQGYPRAADRSLRFERALVLRFGRVGDLLVLTPMLRALAHTSPAGRIDVVTTPAGAAALATSAHTSAVLTLGWRRGPIWLNPQKARLVRRLRRVGYDVAFVFESAPRYHALVAPLSIPRLYSLARPGTAPGAGQVVEEPALHSAGNLDRLLALAGVAHAGWHYDLPIPEDARTRAEALLREHGLEADARPVGVHPGHFQRRRRWRRKRDPRAWPSERFAEVMRRLAARGSSFVLTGSADERALVREIAHALPGARIADLAGRTDLPTLAAVIARCRLFLTLDTGPAHIAAAVRTPLVALFGRLPPTAMGPLGDEERIERIYKEPVSLPASERRDFHPRMWAIEVEDVVAAVARLLRVASDRPRG